MSCVFSYNILLVRQYYYCVIVSLVGHIMSFICCVFSIFVETISSSGFIGIQSQKENGRFKSNSM